MIFYILIVIGISMIFYGLRNLIIKEVKKMNIKWAMVVILGAVLISLLVATAVWKMTGPGYQFNRYVHSHMTNAYYSNEPELMKDELILAIEGMHNLGLTDNMYDAFWDWDKIPSKSMKFQYDHLDGIVSRIDSVIQWKNEVYANNSGQMPTMVINLYEQQMDDLRGFLQEDGWSDWISEGAFYANFHVFYYFWIWIVVLILGALLLLAFIIAFSGS